MTLVVDASVAAKWVVTEDDSREAIALQQQDALAAPDLLAPEVGNVLWRKAKRGELTATGAALAAQALVRADITLHPSLPMLEEAVRLAIELGHPIYDCMYVVLARRLGTQLVTADGRLVARLAASGRPDLRSLARPLV